MSRENTKKSTTTTVSEDQLLKALGDLEAHAEEDVEEEVEQDEEPVAKAKKKDEEDESSEESSEEESVDKAHTEATPGMPDDTKEANGGFRKLKPASEDSENFETGADEYDPSGGSMKSLVEDNEGLRKAFEVSAFLESLTETTCEAVDGLAKSASDFQNEQRTFNQQVRKALTAIGNLMLDMKKSGVESGEEPVVRPRSALVKSDVAERFPENTDGRQYTKSQTLDALTELTMKGAIPSIVVSAYEGSDHVDPQYHGTVNAQLKQMFG